MKPLVLIILDGWGIAQPGPGNAISKITTHNIQFYWNTFPHTELRAAGTAVGLPENEAGNSETGHINIGAGRIVDQDVTRINRSIADGSFYENTVFLEAIQHSQQNKSNIHIIGLLSDEGVHASKDHLIALLTLLEKQKFSSVYLHLFTDGRDALPNSSIPIYKALEKQYPNIRNYKIATVMGRYYGMDRDRRWEKTELAYNALTSQAEFKAASFEEAVINAYARSETDEFIKPTIITDQTGTMYPRIQNKDSVIFFNYRVDRPRQLTRAFTLSDFESHMYQPGFDTNPLIHHDNQSHPFTRTNVLSNLYFVTMTEYEDQTPCHVAYTPKTIDKPLGYIVSQAGLHQLHAAESEKERFVTYYFNGLQEEPYAHEERLIVPSPKVATYDLAPAMSAVELTDKIIEAITIKKYDFIVINFANPDMVGHSGDVEATKKACETVDIQASRIVESVLALDGTCIITSDHGHAEEMLSPKNEIQTEHTSNPVPFIICSNAYKNKNITLPPGVLGDIASTILHIMNIPKPVVMTGHNLLRGVV